MITIAIALQMMNAMPLVTAGNIAQSQSPAGLAGHYVSIKRDVKDEQFVSMMDYDCVRDDACFKAQRDAFDDVREMYKVSDKSYRKALVRSIEHNIEGRLVNWVAIRDDTKEMASQDDPRMAAFDRAERRQRIVGAIANTLAATRTYGCETKISKSGRKARTVCW